MSEINACRETGPRISLKQASVKPAGRSGLWDIIWNVENLGEHPLRLWAAQLPHRQFKSDGQRFEPAVVLGYGGNARFETTVACGETPGTIVENAFVIFNATWLDNPWRIFVRLRVAVEARGQPTAVAELITAQRMGFAAEVQSQS